MTTLAVVLTVSTVRNQVVELPYPLPPLPPVFTRCCNSAFCYAEGSQEERGPCWGEVSVIDEEYTEDDYWWIHACEAHEDHYGDYSGVSHWTAPPSDYKLPPKDQWK